MSHFLQPLLKGAPDGWTLGIAGRGVTLADAIEPVFDSAMRNRGLLSRDGLTPGAALLAPTNAIHTFGLRFPIDVIVAARDGRVLKDPRLSRARVAFACGAFRSVSPGVPPIVQAAPMKSSLSHS